MQIFRIIISTFSEAIGLFILEGFLKITSDTFRNINKRLFLFSIIYFYSFILAFFSEFNLIGLISESKPFILLLLLTLAIKTAKKYSLSHLHIFSKSLILFGIILLFLSFLSTGRFFRFVDFTPFFSHYLSIYFGVSVALIIPFLKSKKWILLASSLVLINASGTGIIALIVVLSSMVLTKPLKFQTILAFIFLFMIAVFFLFLGQNQRGRSLEGFNQIDRVVLSIAATETIFNSSKKELLVGRPLSSSLPLADFIEFQPVKEYILAENNGYIYPRNVHNEHLRLILQFGIIGYFLVWNLLYNLFKEKRVVFWILFFSGFSNMVLSITPIIFITIMIIRSQLTFNTN